MIKILEKINNIGIPVNRITSFLARIEAFGMNILGVANSALTHEKYSFSNELPKFSLEEGVNIQNYIINGGLLIEQSFFVSNFFGGSKEKIPFSTSIIIQGITFLRKLKSPVTVATSHGFYTNMFIENCEIDHVQNSKNSLAVLIRFREILSSGSGEFKANSLSFNKINAPKSKIVDFNKSSSDIKNLGSFSAFAG